MAIVVTVSITKAEALYLIELLREKCPTDKLATDIEVEIDREETRIPL